VSIIVAARNEAERLAARLDNLLGLDYPDHLREIVVVSNGSTDATLEVLSAYRDRLRAIRVPESGKALALNAGVAHARHAILVFADARQIFERGALRSLVANFADPSVGGVSGELVLDCEAADGGAAQSSIADGLGAYWRYEKWLRRHESAVGSTLGATGCIYALRRSLWRPLPPDTLLDDVLAPMRAVLKGARMVFDERARAFDRAASDAGAEARRKIRTLAGNYQILWLEPRLLIPIVNPVWPQYMSHKIGRLLVPYALLAIFGSSAVLALERGGYLAVFAVQLAFYLLALYGAVLDRRESGKIRPRSAGSRAQAAPVLRRGITQLCWLLATSMAASRLYGLMLQDVRLWNG
jgi:cellulose synthase/poly-beta-1,6-N-acetylglucosamine synthase-like glycosyltransferase